MKIIAISDAPIPEKGYYHNGNYIERAYYKGDIFEAYWQNTLLIIYHHIGKMEVSEENFISVEEFRNQKLDQIGIV